MPEGETTVNVELATGGTITVRGTLEAVFERLNRADGFALLTDTNGRKHAVNPAQVVHAEEFRAS